MSRSLTRRAALQSGVVARSQLHAAGVPNGLVVEVAGYKTHASRRALERDADRRRALRERGVPVIDFTSTGVFERPSFVADELVPHLALGGRAV